MTEQSTNSILSRPAVVGVIAILALAAGIGSAMLVQRLSAQSLEENLALVQDMPAEEKAALQEKRKRFMEKDEQERKELADIYQQIEASPQREELQATMTAYYSWLKSLDSYDRRSVRDTSLSTEERINRVLTVRLEKVNSLPFRSGDDIEFFADWLRKYVLVHVEGVEPSDYDWNWDRTWALAFTKWINEGDSKIPEPSVEMFAELVSRLGVEREFRDSGLLDPDRAEDRKEILADRINRLLFLSRRGGRRRGEEFLEIDPDELLKFLASDRLPDEAKSRLSNMDLLRQNRLLTYYFLKDRDPEWWRRLGVRSGRGNRGNRGPDRGGRDRGGEDNRDRGNQGRGGERGPARPQGAPPEGDLPPGENPPMQQIPEFVSPF